MGNRYAQTGEEGYYYTPSPQIKALPQSLTKPTEIVQGECITIRDTRA